MGVMIGAKRQPSVCRFCEYRVRHSQYIYVNDCVFFTCRGKNHEIDDRDCEDYIKRIPKWKRILMPKWAKKQDSMRNLLDL